MYVSDGICCYIFSICGDSHLYRFNYVQCHIGFSFSPYYHYHLTPILRIYKGVKFCYAYSFPIFQHCSYRHDIFFHYELLLCSSLMSVRLCWISSAPNCVSHFHSNLDYLTIVRASKIVSIPASFLWLELLGWLFVHLFLIVTVTSFRFLHIPPR